MLYLFLKAAISGVLIAAASEVAKRLPTIGGLIASLPLVSVLAMIWLWRDTRDPIRVAAQAGSTFWYVLPSMPLFALVPLLLRRGLGFWPALACGCVVTMVLYAAMIFLGPRVGLKL